MQGASHGHQPLEHAAWASKMQRVLAMVMTMIAAITHGHLQNFWAWGLRLITQSATEDYQWTHNGRCHLERALQFSGLLYRDGKHKLRKPDKGWGCGTHGCSLEKRLFPDVELNKYKILHFHCWWGSSVCAKCALLHFICDAFLRHWKWTSSTIL